MRLIELDVAVQNTHKEIFWTESQRASMQNFLFHQPTIDPESLRPKGRWEVNKEYGDYECSVCKSGDITALHFSQLRMTTAPTAVRRWRGEGWQ